MGKLGAKAHRLAQSKKETSRTSGGALLTARQDPPFRDHGMGKSMGGSAELCKLRDDISALEALLIASEQKLAEVDTGRSTAPVSSYLDLLRGYEAGLAAVSEELTGELCSKEDCCNATLNAEGRFDTLDTLEAEACPPGSLGGSAQRPPEEEPEFMWPHADVSGVSFYQSSFQPADASTCEAQQDMVLPTSFPDATEEASVVAHQINTRGAVHPRRSSLPPSHGSSCDGSGSGCCHEDTLLREPSPIPSLLGAEPSGASSAASPVHLPSFVEARCAFGEDINTRARHISGDDVPGFAGNGLQGEESIGGYSSEVISTHSATPCRQHSSPGGIAPNPLPWPASEAHLSSGISALCEGRMPRPGVALTPADASTSSHTSGIDSQETSCQKTLMAQFEGAEALHDWLRDTDCGCVRRGAGVPFRCPNNDMQLARSSPSTGPQPAELVEQSRTGPRLVLPKVEQLLQVGKPLPVTGTHGHPEHSARIMQVEWAAGTVADHSAQLRPRLSGGSLLHELWRDSQPTTADHGPRLGPWVTQTEHHRLGIGSEPVYSAAGVTNSHFHDGLQVQQHSVSASNHGRVFSTPSWTSSGEERSDLHNIPCGRQCVTSSLRLPGTQLLRDLDFSPESKIRIQPGLLGHGCDVDRSKTGGGWSPTPRDQKCTEQVPDACVDHSLREGTRGVPAQTDLTVTRPRRVSPTTLCRLGSPPDAGATERTSEGSSRHREDVSVIEASNLQHITNSVLSARSRTCSAPSSGADPAPSDHSERPEKPNSASRLPLRSSAPSQAAHCGDSDKGALCGNGKWVREQDNMSGKTEEAMRAAVDSAASSTDALRVEALPTTSPRVTDVDLPYREGSISRQTLCVELKEVQDMLLRLMDDGIVQTEDTRAPTSVHCLRDATPRNAEATTCGLRQREASCAAGDVHRATILSCLPNSSDRCRREDTEALPESAAPAPCDTSLSCEDANLSLSVAQVTEKLHQELDHICSLQPGRAATNTDPTVSTTPRNSSKLIGAGRASSVCLKTRRLSVKSPCETGARGRTDLGKGKTARPSVHKSNGLGSVCQSANTIETGKNERTIPRGDAAPLKIFKCGTSSPATCTREKSVDVSSLDPGKQLARGSIFVKSEREIRSKSTDIETSATMTGCSAHASTRRLPHLSRDKLGDSGSKCRDTSSLSRTPGRRAPALSSAGGDRGSYAKETKTTRPPRVTLTTALAQRRRRSHGPADSGGSRTAADSTERTSTAGPRPDSCRGSPAGCESKRHPGCWRRINRPTMHKATNTEHVAAVFSPSSVQQQACGASPREQVCGPWSEVDPRAAGGMLTSTGRRTTLTHVQRAPAVKVCTERGRHLAKATPQAVSQRTRSRNQSTSSTCCRQGHSASAAYGGEEREAAGRVKRTSLSPAPSRWSRQNFFRLPNGDYVSVWMCKESRSVPDELVSRPRSSFPAALTLEASTCWSSPLSRIASGVSAPVSRRISLCRTPSERSSRPLRLYPENASTSLSRASRGGDVAAEGMLTSATRNAPAAKSEHRLSFTSQFKNCYRNAFDRTLVKAASNPSLEYPTRETGVPSKLSSFDESPTTGALSQDEKELEIAHAERHQGVYHREQGKGVAGSSSALLPAQKTEMSKSPAGTPATGITRSPSADRVTRAERRCCGAPPERRPHVADQTCEQALVLVASEERRAGPRLPGNTRGPVHRAAVAREAAGSATTARPVLGSCERRAIICSPSEDAQPEERSRSTGIGLKGTSVERNHTDRQSSRREEIEQEGSAASRRPRSNLSVTDKTLQPERATMPLGLTRRPQQRVRAVRHDRAKMRAASSASVASSRVSVSSRRSQELSLEKIPSHVPAIAKDARKQRYIGRRQPDRPAAEYRSAGELVLTLPSNAGTVGDCAKGQATREESQLGRASAAGSDCEPRSETKKQKESQSTPFTTSTLSASPSSIGEAHFAGNCLLSSRVKDHNPTRCTSRGSARLRSFPEASVGVTNIRSSGPFPLCTVRASVHASIKQRKSEEAAREGNAGGRQDPLERTESLPLSTYTKSCPDALLPASRLVARETEGYQDVMPGAKALAAVYDIPRSASKIGAVLWESSLPASRFSDSPASSTAERGEGASVRRTGAAETAWLESSVAHTLPSEKVARESLSYSTDNRSTAPPTTVYQMTSQTEDPLCSQLTYVSDKELAGGSPSHEDDSLSEKGFPSDDGSCCASEVRVSPKGARLSMRSMRVNRVTQLLTGTRPDGGRNSNENAQLLASTDGIVTTRRPVLQRPAIRRPSTGSHAGRKSTVARSSISIGRNGAERRTASPLCEKRMPPPVLEFNMAVPSGRKADERRKHFLDYLAQHYGKQVSRKQSTDSEPEEENVRRPSRSSAPRLRRQEHPPETCDAANSEDAETKKKFQHSTRSRSFGCASNRAPIMRALEHICLAGKLNTKKREKLFSCFEGPWHDIRIFIILLKDTCGASWDLRALYALHPRKGFLKVAQVSPAPSKLEESMVKHLYRYDSGSKTLHLLEGARTIGPTTVAATLIKGCL